MANTVEFMMGNQAMRAAVQGKKDKLQLEDIQHERIQAVVSAHGDHTASDIIYLRTGQFTMAVPLNTP